MARGERSENHPGRQVNRAAFGIGDVVHVPAIPSFRGKGGFPGGPVTVDQVSKGKFSGKLPTGERLGTTSMGLSMGHKMGKEPEPWPIEYRGSIPG